MTFPIRALHSPVRAAAVLAAAVTAAPARAEPSGCYLRAYDAKHLARNPQQVVTRLRALVLPDRGRLLLWANIVPQVADPDRLFVAALSCQPTNAGHACFDDEGGGAVTYAEREDGALILSTDMMFVVDVDGASGSVDLAEPGAEVTRYRLDRGTEWDCEGLP